MKKPNDKQIEAEIKRLTEMKPTVLKRSKFGDDHHAAIDAQIEVLTERMGENDACDKFPCKEDNDIEGFPENITFAAREAACWLEGLSDELPSDGWKELVIN